MDQLLATTLIGLFVGMVGTGTGGLITFCIRNPGKKFLSFILGLSSGLMLAIISFNLLPEAFEMGSLTTGVIGILLGVGTIILLDEKLSSRMKNYRDYADRSFIKTGILLGLGVALHNFPEGLAIGSGFVAKKELGIGIAIVIGLHNMPEGISMAAPMSIGGMKRWKAFAYTVLAGMPMGLGAFLGALLGGISPHFISFCLAFAGGTMLYITCGELIPKSNNLSFGRISTYGLILGFVTGIIVSVRI
ncbi:MAG: ZIP family metal transporter [Thermotaleaceae bacterium]